MIKLKSIEVLNTFSLDYLIVRYRCEDTIEDLNKYKFDIYRSNSPDGDFQLIASNIADFEYADNTVNLYKPSVRYYYKIKVKNSADGKEEFSSLVGELLYHQPDNISNTVISQYNTYLENVVNNPEIRILIKRRFGQRCQVCWDDVRMQTKLEDCTECYGTGYSGGYMPPIRTKMSYISGEAGMQQTMEMSDVGEVQNPIQIWIKNYPIVQPGDIIVDKLNRRYEVINWNPTVKNGYVLRQIITIQRLPASNIAYKVPLGTEV